MTLQPGIRWTSYSKSIDIDTGEIITDKKAKEEYIIIKIIKNATINTIQTRGHIEFTKLYRRNPQSKLDLK